MKPSKEMIENEQASRRLDAWVAEYVMGWTDVKAMRAAGAPMIHRGYPPGMKRRTDWQDVPDYSRDIAAAWEVVDRVASALFEIEIQPSPEEYLRGMAEGKPAQMVRVIVGRTTCIGPLPLAVCKASLIDMLEKADDR